MWKIAKFALTGLFLIGLFFKLSVLTGAVPDSKVVSGDELPSDAVAVLRDLGIISRNEEIHYYYSEDLFSFENYGNLFTDKRVVSYETDEDTGERAIYSATYDEVSDITLEKSSSTFENSLIEVNIDGEHDFYLVVSQEENGDEIFYKKLVERWKSAKNL